jgi:RNA polymerase sigma factor (sigma-70 family)
MANGLRMVLDHLRQVLPPTEGGGLTDGQLLARFVASRDESAFAALVQRHGPMVLGVCRRVLRHAQDAEDAFQATFLVLACKAASVVKRESVGSWLYGAAYRTALDARSANVRRQVREKQVEDLPQPAVAPAEPQDWRPLLDGEVRRLPTKYQAALVLCDLEGRGRKEAARQLGIPEGTLSSRLATARRLLAQRLSRRGVALPAGAVVAALLTGETSAGLAPLVWPTARVAGLAAAGRLVPPAAAALDKGVLQTMFLAKVKVAVAMVLALGLGAGGVAYHTAAPRAAQAAAPEKPADLEALRKENELLKLNLRVVLEKVRAQETDLAAVKAELLAVKAAEAARKKGAQHALAFPSPFNNALLTSPGITQWHNLNPFLPATNNTIWLTPANAPPFGLGFPQHQLNLTFRPKKAVEKRPAPAPDPVKEVEDASKALRAARDKEARRRAADALEKALKRLREQLK